MSECPAMRSALESIRSEHRSVYAVLHGLRYLVREIREGRLEPDFPLLWKMIYYLDAFPERHHHPKEDEYLYKAIRARTRQIDEELDDLGREHAQGSDNMRSLALALGRYEGVGDAEFPAFAEIIERYAHFQLKHMAKEEDLVLPVAAQVLSEDDWRLIDQAFKAHDDPLAGTGDEVDLRLLFTRIALLAPPPIGLGGGHENGGRASVAGARQE